MLHYIRKTVPVIVATQFLLFAPSCAPRSGSEPVLYPNNYYELVGAGVGAGTGALAGTIMKGKVGRATAAGAAVGSVLGIARELTRDGNNSPSYRDFVNHCLERKGYEVSGWS